jgi:hypothetical protein
MSATDWLQIVLGFRYCVRWSILVAAEILTSHRTSRPRKKPCSRPRLTESG